MKEYIYLNNAATSYPKPDSVIRAISKFLRKPPVNYLRSGIEHDATIVEKCRSELASFFNVSDTNNIVFSSGATESLNLAIFGLNLDGKHVITTAVEHNSVLRPLKTLEKQGRISLSITKCNTYGQVKPEDIEKSIKPNTFAVFVNHCSNVTGAVNDIESIGLITKNRDIIFVVDASQSAGLYPIDVKKSNIDILVFTGHKSFFGLQGVGGAYISSKIKLKPLKVGGTGVRSDYLLQPETVPLYYEAGTLNIPGIISIYEGIKYIRRVGMDNIRLKKQQLIEVIKKTLSKNKNIFIYPNLDSKLRTTLCCFTIKNMEPDDIAYIMEKNFNIIVRPGLHCAPLIHKYLGTFPLGSVRISPSHFTTDLELEVLKSAITKILKMSERL